MGECDSTLKMSCTKCGEQKPINCFSKVNSSSEKFRKICKKCRCDYQSNRYKSLPEVRARMIRLAKESNKRNNELRLIRAAAKYKSDAATRKRLADNQRARYQLVRNDPIFILKKSISSSLLRSIGNAKARTHWYEIVGYSVEDLRSHLQKQFVKGMSWENYGAWHVDHITPIASFDFSYNPLGVAKIAWALPNLRPLWKHDNQRKHAKITLLI